MALYFNTAFLPEVLCCVVAAFEDKVFVTEPNALTTFIPSLDPSVAITLRPC